MSALLSKLRQLRAEAGNPAAGMPGQRMQSESKKPNVWTAKITNAAAPASTAPIARGISPDVRRLLQRHAQLKQAPSHVSAPSSDRLVPGIEIAPGLRYSETHIDWLKPPAVIDARFARVDADVAHRHLLHFDTETTGLAGGTGTRAFMIGTGDWIDGRFRIRQLTITSMAAETAMLKRFAEWINNDTVLVSYNGKSYDAPLLATRYRLARLTNPLIGLKHIDLVHPVRRQWKTEWENCRLATAERKLLGVVREDDLPGAEAPAAWLTYLRGGSARNLRRVAEHNAQDLKSLAGVLLKMAAITAPA